VFAGFFNELNKGVFADSDNHNHLQITYCEESTHSILPTVIIGIV
jgi:hypothetical protein